MSEETVHSETHFRSQMGDRSAFYHVESPSGAEYDLPVAREAAVRLYKHYRDFGKGVRVEISPSGAFIIHGAA